MVPGAPRGSRVSTVHVPAASVRPPAHPDRSLRPEGPRNLLQVTQRLVDKAGLEPGSMRPTLATEAEEGS